jgi:hypothetical protein
MARFQLGEIESARAALAQLQQIVAAPDARLGEDVKALAREAEAMVAPR